MSGLTRKTIGFTETTIIDSEFVAAYQEKTFAAYVRHCVRMETQKRLKDIKKRIEEEIHVNTMLDAPQRSGNESESNYALRQIVLEILKQERDNSPSLTVHADGKHEYKNGA